MGAGMWHVPEVDAWCPGLGVKSAGSAAWWRRRSLGALVSESCERCKVALVAYSEARCRPLGSMRGVIPDQFLTGGDVVLTGAKGEFIDKLDQFLTGGDVVLTGLQGGTYR